MRFQNLYYLMHRNDVVTGLELEPVSGSIIKISKKQNKDLLPPGAGVSSDMLKRWWKNRAVPIEQGNIEKILKDNDISTTQAYLTVNYGVSLIDHYWIKPVESGLKWEEVNLFTNPFRDEMAEIQFGERETLSGISIGTGLYPGASAQGELQKKWILSGKKRCLIKGNYGSSCQQSLNEVMSSKLHRKQGNMPFVIYEPCKINTPDGKGVGCICENFAGENYEFIPALDVVNSEKKRNEKSEYEHFISVCEKNGLSEEKTRPFLEYQIMTDFLITNTDRHFNNFGVLRDTRTLRYIEMAPIFDSGNSMFWRNPSLPLSDNLLEISVSSFRKREVDLLQYVTEKSIVDLNNILSKEELLEIYSYSKCMEERLKGIVKGYERKAELLEKFQKGEKIWGYQYQG